MTKPPETAKDEVQPDAEATQELSARITRRVRAAMRQQGFPQSGYNAFQALADATGWNLTVVSQVLSGKVTPTLQQLLVLSEVLDHPMAYWFDQNEPPLPRDLHRVPGESGEEDLILRLEDGFLPPEVKTAGMVHHRTRRPMGFGVEAGDSVVASKVMPVGGPRTGHLYLFRHDDDFQILVCVESDGRGVFRRIDDAAVPRIGAASAHASGKEFSCGQVVAIIRAGEQFHTAAIGAWRAAQPVKR